MWNEFTSACCESLGYVSLKHHFHYCHRQDMTAQLHSCKHLGRGCRQPFDLPQVRGSLGQENVSAHVIPILPESFFFASALSTTVA